MRVVSALATTLVIMLSLRAAPAAAQGQTSMCPADRAAPISAADKVLLGSAVATWEAIETLDGIVPDIEEDRTQAPPRWWRYPSAVRSSALLQAEARRKDGLYVEVDPSDLTAGDLLVRLRGAGPCGRMAVVAGSPGDLVAIEGLKAPGSKDAPPPDSTDAFFDRGLLRPEVKAYRINMRKDSTAGHARELRRDLTHLERTIGERPLLLAKGGRAVVDEKVHQLVDEAWSLGLDPDFSAERGTFTGRALVLGAALDWPGAAGAAAAVLDETLRRRPDDREAMTARGALHLLRGEAAAARPLLEKATAGTAGPPRARYLLARALMALGERDRGLQLMRKLAGEDPDDRRAADALNDKGSLLPAPAGQPGVELAATTERISFRCEGTSLSWPITWRATNVTTLPGQGFVVNLMTGRENLDSGRSHRAAVVVMAQRPGTAAAAATLVKNGAREMFPKAKRKKLTPVLAGSTRERFQERHDGEQRAGEVNAVERGGRVFYFVLNAPAEAYERFRPAFEELLKGFTADGAPAPKP